MPEIRRKYTLKYPLLMFLGGGGRPMGGDHGRSCHSTLKKAQRRNWSIPIL
jgi:hypothetical protein